MIDMTATIRCGACKAARTITIQLTCMPLNPEGWANLTLQAVQLPEGWRLVPTAQSGVSLLCDAHGKDPYR
jgi:hypothetical protein